LRRSEGEQQNFMQGGKLMKNRVSRIWYGAVVMVFLAQALIPAFQMDVAAAAGSDNVADYILYNGKVVTVDSKFSIAQAVAIKNDKIIAVGTDDQVLALATDKTERIDLRGKTLLPGLTESHSHLTQAAESEFFGEIYIPQSVEALLSYVGKKAESLKEGEWIYFRNTYPTRLKEYRFPTLKELDSAAPKNPVFVDGAYAGQANSYAMKIAKIDENTPQPPVGEIVKDPATGKPTGVFLRSQSLVTRHYPGVRKLNHEQRMEALRKLTRNYNQLGITSVIDGGTLPDAVAAFNELYKRGELTVRMSYTIRPDISKPKDDIVRQVKALLPLIKTPEDWGKLYFLKAWVDGGILTGTALMREPYGTTGPLHKQVFGHTDPNFKGVLTLDPDAYTRAAEVAYELNLQMTAHCIGDGALDVLFAAYKRVNAANPIKNRRWSAIHGDFTDEEMLRMMAELGIVNIAQVAWFYKDGDILSKILTERAVKSFYPFRTMEKLGVVATGGSDHMVKWDSLESVNPYNPWLSMYAMVTRQTERGGVLMPEERISRESALKQYTINGAYAIFAENLKGSIEVGKLADLVVIDKDYLTCPAEEIKGIRAVLTMVGGKVVHR
jgi:predicted amidohydrolase YtcJ